MRDYQTAGGDRDQKRKTLFLAGGEAVSRTVVGPRYYLADAAFLVGLEGADLLLLAAIHAALRAPVWPLALGRKSFAPGMPVYLPGGLKDEPLLEALKAHPRLAAAAHGAAPGLLRVSLEDEREGSMRLDQPTGPFSQRAFGPRLVRSEVVDVPDPTYA